MMGMKGLVIVSAVMLPIILSACSDSSDRRPSEVVANPCVGVETTSSRLFLQQVSSDSAIVKWRGDASELCFGSDPSKLQHLVDAQETAGEHKEALLSGLSPDTRYYYSIGAAATAPEGQFFNSSPLSGKLPKDGNTRIWLVGDSGTGGDDEREAHEGEAAAVRDGMLTFVEQSGGEAVDLFIMLGDNAYEVGSDLNYQQAVFETYPSILKTTPLWPTIGNHEMGAGQLDLCAYVEIPCGNSFLFHGGVSTSAEPEQWIEEEGAAPTLMPYLDIFTLPTAAEVGGVASGTEQYYSFDYANVHIVSLDSQLTARDEQQRATMRQWLIDDLASNTLDWTVVIFHHPPYSKGANHDSDQTENNPIDRPMWDMRNEFVPIFEQYGVDVVYSGHSHSYERSYYLRGHLGTSDTFSAAQHAELIDGDPTRPSLGQGDHRYAQLSPSSGGINDRVVYSVAGNSGKADSNSGATKPEQWLRHAAHIRQEADSLEDKRHGLAVIGSVIIDAGEHELRANFIDHNGTVLDHFIITR
ncbi:metallophosphoesterase family protein [Parahaliea sp. F7430]|uniref:Metallophosphoesterase family protein n=1 Tax=Sediminihaliea albiluteola TaxID=2758564 RepID=A0A7W2TV49_9GAMM|nr:metallophosphoesterase family protein [Sediminihaliea albiluteola]MBA6412469.1 metallophosphoesterase family protein [Sediminihaliea albiluteola]